MGLSEEEATTQVVDEITAIQTGRRMPEGDALLPGAPMGSEELLFPASLPRAWNLPLRLRDFFGRTGLLASMQKRLSDYRICVLTGLGGVGKSRTALEYAHLHAAEYDIVWRNPRGRGAECESRPSRACPITGRRGRGRDVPGGPSRRGA